MLCCQWASRSICTTEGPGAVVGGLLPWLLAASLELGCTSRHSQEQPGKGDSPQGNAGFTSLWNKTQPRDTAVDGNK